MTSVFDPVLGMSPLADGLWGLIGELIMPMSDIQRYSDAIEAALHFEREGSHAVGHVNALINAYLRGSDREPLRPHMTREWHAMLFPAGEGAYRTAEAFMCGSGFAGTPPHFIPSAMFILAGNISWIMDRAIGEELSVWSAMAEAHLQFERIHPFADGNGRVGRVLLQYTAGFLRCCPICLRMSSKNEYIRSLEAGDVQRLAILFRESEWR